MSKIDLGLAHLVRSPAQRKKSKPMINKKYFFILFLLAGDDKSVGINVLKNI
jgi:hypothetical protein